MAEGRVDDVLNAANPLPDLALVRQRANGEATPLLDPISNLVDTLRQIPAQGQVARQKIGALLEAGVLNQRLVVGMVVRDADGRPMLESLDKQPRAIGPHHPLRPDDLVQAAAPRPVKDSLKQGAGHLKVVD